MRKWPRRQKTFSAGLREKAGPEWQAALGSWGLYRDVFVDLPPTFEVPAGLAPLVPGVEAKPELCGGLPLGLLGGERLYLHGGPPDIWLPNWLSETIDTPPIGR